jgi:hypothetical protein
MVSEHYALLIAGNADALVRTSARSALMRFPQLGLPRFSLVALNADEGVRVSSKKWPDYL